MKYAIIDIGSNSIRYMEEDRSCRKTITTRLGSGLAKTGMISAESLKRSVSVIAALADDARHAGYIPEAYATSAVRDCKNREEVLKAIYEASGVMPRVLTGEEEADFAFSAAVQPSEKGLIDIGGASTEIVTRDFSRSFPVGCVRGRDIALMETGAENCDDNWPAQRKTLEDYMDKLFDFPNPDFSPCVGVGGSITTLAALNLKLSGFEPKQVHNSVLTRPALEEEISLLCRLGDKRREHPILKKRHDVILYGAALLAYLMDRFKLDSLRVSLRDGMDGYLMHLCSERDSCAG